MATSTADVIDREDFPDAEDDAGEEQSFTLLDLLDPDLNIADILSDEQRGTIGERVVREYRIDKASRKDWEDCNKEALDLALQVTKEKNYPWKGAANIKYPLLTTAAIQFAARAYPAIIGGPEVVKAKVQGRDEDGKKRSRGERIARHMSYQLTQEMEEWEADTDRLLHIVPISGMCFRKTYFDATLGRNRSELVTPDKLIVNDGARDIETVPRITQECEFYPYEIEERFRTGLWKRFELGPAEGGAEDEEAPHVFLEQHRTIDLDDDGYAEPYIVTCHRDTAKIVRVVANFEEKDIALNDKGEVARIERTQYFTKFGLLPNPAGGFHDIGFGYLLKPINEAVNTTLNQLLDAGHLANVGGGFIGTGARLRGGMKRRRPGEWQPVEVSGQSLRDNMVPFPSQEPSMVLFQLLGLLIEAGKDISAVKDVMTGSEPKSANTPATTTLALIEQGMQVFSAIYKRIYRSLKSEYGKLYALNSRYLDEDTYFRLLDEEEAVAKDDYAQGDLDVVPVADPNVVTNMQRLARAQFLMQFAGDPHFDGLKIRRRMLEAASIEDVDDLIVKEPPQDPVVAQKADEIDIKKRELAIKEMEAMANIDLHRAQALKAIAEAEGVEPGNQIAAYKAWLDALNAREKLILERQQGDGGTVSGMEGQPGNGSIPAAPGTGAGTAQGAMGAG